MFRRRLLLQFLKFVDLCIIILAIDFSIGVTHSQFMHFWPESIHAMLTNSYPLRDIILFVFNLYIWHTVFEHHGLYLSRRLSTLNREILDIIKATTLGSVAITIVFAVISKVVVDLQFVALLWITSTLITLLSRVAMRSILGQLRCFGRNKRKILIVGTNEQAIEFSQKIRYCLELGYDLIGFVDNPSNTHNSTAQSNQIVSSIEKLPDFLCRTQVDEVAIFYPMRSHYDEIHEVISICEQHGIMIRMRTNMFELNLGKSFVDQIVGEPLITIYTGNMNNRGWKIIIKHAFDFYVSLTMLILLSPLLLLVTLLIKLDSKGPVFFTQERIGRNKARFRMYKFRTMSADAEQRIQDVEHMNEVDGPVFKIKNDPRITRLGKWLRKTSIDELPQLINVLKGDMSLVGPRPLPERDYNYFKTHWHRRRFSVRPGITCLWQISGRSNISFERWMEMDMEYIDNWSLTMDIKILLGTIRTVITGYGAY